MFELNRTVLLHKFGGITNVPKDVFFPGLSRQAKCSWSVPAPRLLP